MRDDESEFDPAIPDVPEQSTNGSAPPEAILVEEADIGETSPASTADDGDAFLADLARAMQTTAVTEHARVSEDIERRRQEHIDRIRARETAEADELRAHAEDGVRGIDSWADAEIERIQRERERRILARRRDLEISLEDHRSLVGREVDAVEASIAAYRTEVETYFGRLEAETDPVAIASQAGTRPAFPALDSIGPGDGPAAAGGPSRDDFAAIEPSGDEAPAPSEDTGEPVTASATDEGASMVGVMDSAAPTEAEPADAIDSLVGATADTPAPDANADPSDSLEREPQQSEETTAQANAVMPRSSAALLQAVPSLRPMASWFRRDSDQANGAGDDGQSG
jgi:hypothetical protein